MPGFFRAYLQPKTSGSVQASGPDADERDLGRPGLVGTIFFQGEPNTLLGPVGLIGGLGFALVAAGILVCGGGRE